MNSAFVVFNAEIARQLPDVTTRRVLLSSAISVALSHLLPLPSSPVEDPSNYYNLQVSPLVRSRADFVNENIVIDCKDVLSFTREMWMLRYRAVHPQKSFFEINGSGFFDTIMGIDTVIAPERKALLDANKGAVLNLVAIARAVFTEL